MGEQIKQIYTSNGLELWKLISEKIPGKSTWPFGRPPGSNKRITESWIIKYFDLSGVIYSSHALGKIYDIYMTSGRALSLNDL